MPKFKINCTVLGKEYNVTIEAKDSAEAQRILFQEIAKATVINSIQEQTSEKSKDFNIGDIFNFLK
mgnify:CR=1 FL=1